MLLNWITSTGDFVLTSWLVDIARREAPGAEAGYIGQFMGRYCATVTLVGFLVQLLLVSRIIQFAGLARALLVTPVAFVAGYLLVGIVPAFLLLQSVLVMQRSFDYSLLNTTRNALLLPMGREAKYQAKTAIDTFFYRAGDLLATGSVVLGMRLFDDARTAVRLAHRRAEPHDDGCRLAGRAASTRDASAARRQRTIEARRGALGRARCSSSSRSRRLSSASIWRRCSHGSSARSQRGPVERSEARARTPAGARSASGTAAAADPASA